MLKVLVFAEFGWCNGGENSFLAVATALRHKFKFVVACPKDGELKQRAVECGLESIDWDIRNDDGIRLTQTQIRSDIGDIIGRCRPNLVHANSLSTARLCGPVTSQLGVRCLGYLRDIIKLSKTAVSDINECDRLVAVSEATRDFHLNQDISPSKTTVIHNGVDLCKFNPGAVGNQSMHHELNLPADTQLITCIGQIGIRKGTDVVIRAFTKLQNQVPHLALLLIGIRNSMKQESIEFEDHCQKLTNGNERIFWLGRRTDVPEIMAQSRLLLHGAHQEPLGRVLLEALATGLPFIATDVGGTRELIPDDSNCNDLLYSPGDWVALTQLAAEVLSNPSKCQLISNLFRKTAESKFDIENCAAQLKDEYRQLLE